MVVFDVVHLFTIFGGPAGLLAVLNRYQPGIDLNYNVVQMWQQRRTIPSRWMGIVLYCVDREGHHVHEFLIDNEELKSDAGPGG